MNLFIYSKGHVSAELILLKCSMVSPSDIDYSLSKDCYPTFENLTVICCLDLLMDMHYYISKQIRFPPPLENSHVNRVYNYTLQINGHHVDI